MLDIKKNEIMSFVATWMDLEIIILSAVRERQISNYISYIQTLKNYTNKLVNETGKDSQT